MEIKSKQDLLKKTKIILNMSKPTLGIIGGGQLGSMLASAAKKLKIKTVIFSDDFDAPAQKFADEFIYGNYDDEKKINEFITKMKCSNL